MKYIKKFEYEKHENKHWLVSTSLPYSHLSFGLRKIGMSEYKIDTWCSTIIRLSDKHDDIYLFLDYDDSDPDDWSWSGSNYNIRNISEFMGRLTVKDYELDAEKYNL